jgi:hypothetical protein
MTVASRGRAAAVVGLGAVLLAWIPFAACSSSDAPPEEQDAGPAANAEPLFRALQDDLVKTCGGPNGMCHVRGTYQSAPKWLGDPDPYLSAKRYRGIIPATRDVSDSIILTQVAHEGPSLKDVGGPSPTLFERVGTWLQAEIPEPPLPNTGAFSVRDGFNSVPLDTLASGLTGARLNFLATEANGVLTLSALKIAAPNDANVHVDSPFFVILPRSGKVNADPERNGFKGELTVPAGTSADLFAGKMILLRWDPAGTLKVVFQKIDSTPGKAMSADCNALDQFSGSALNAMSMQVDVVDPDEGDGGVGGGDGGAIIGTGSCLGCHGDESAQPKYPAAINAMDLRGANADPAKACKQARVWIGFDDKPNSTILLNPQGKSNPNHPMKPVPADDPIVQGIAQWVNAEQP